MEAEKPSPQPRRSGAIPKAPRRADDGAIHRAYLASLLAGPARQAVDVLSDDQLNQPIEVAPQSLPSIRGYRIEQLIAQGSPASVYKGVVLSSGKPVAIKVMPGGSLVKKSQLSRFDREANLLAAFNHPNIVGIHDRGQTADGSWFFAMRYISGWNLDEFISKNLGPADTRKLIRIFIKITAAMGEAHRCGVVHRDLKPSNIRIDRRGEPHVLDFGLARSFSSVLASANESRQDSLTVTGQFVGSLPWASPEQVTLGRVNAASDVYSIGVMLYHAVAGRFPYAVDGPIRETLDNITRAALTAPTLQNDARPAERADVLDAIVLRSLAKNAAERYESASELGEDLARYLAGRLTDARPAPVQRATLLRTIAKALRRKSAKRR